MDELSSEIRAACGAGKAVVVRHINPLFLTTPFDVDTIKKLRNVDIVLDWQGMQCNIHPMTY